MSHNQLAEGVVFRAQSGLYQVQTPGGETVACRLRGNLKKRFAYSTSTSLPRRVEGARKQRVNDPLSVGDAVRFDPALRVIEAILPRRSELARRSPFSIDKQVLVANLDRLFVVFAAAQPEPDFHRLDRFLVMAGDAGVPAGLVVNKSELPCSDDTRAAFAVYAAIGYPVFTTSAYAETGLEALRAAMEGRITAFVGPSSVGKSSLLNALYPDLGLRVGRVSAANVAHQGRHTTTSAELIPLSPETGGWVADTPGLRQVDYWHIAREEIALHFPELAPYRDRCRFTDCLHRDEPDCAVRAALEAGNLSVCRYQSYRRMIG